MSAFDTESETPEFENLASLAENIVYRIPGCSDMMVRKTIQDVYREFCRRSCCLRGRRHFTISENDHHISCAPQYGGVVDCVTEVRLEGRIILKDRSWSSYGGNIELSHHILPGHDQTREIDVEFVEMPLMNSERIPSWFIQKHGDAVISGTLSRIMSMTGKAWSDPSQAADERLRYENAVNETRIRYYAHNDNGDMGYAVDCSGLI